MKIKILGTRGEIEPTAPYHALHSGILLDNKLLFDAGEKEFFEYRPKYIFITHLHPDHAYFIRKGSEKFKNKSIIYAPETYKNTDIKILTKLIKVGAYEITPIPTIHSIKVKSQAYLIKKGKGKILYTGDMIWIEKKYHKLLQDLTLVITEASHIREKGLVRRETETGRIYGHNGIPDLIRFFRKYTQHLLFMHFGTWFYEDVQKAKQKIQSLARKYKLNCYVGYDGLSIDTKDLK